MSKILVICFSSINNVAMAIPVIHSLATQYAQHQIMVLSIDTFSPYSRMCWQCYFPWGRFQRRTCRINGSGMAVQWFKRRKFDAVAAFQPTFRSRFLCWRFRLAGIKAAHIKQNRRELQKLIRRKHKIYTEQDLFQRCAHTLSQIGYPIRLSFLSLFGKNKGNISSLAPLTGEKTKRHGLNRSLCNTCRQNLSVVKARADPQTSICTRPYKNLLIRRREKEIKVLKNGPNISTSSQQPAN